MPLVLTVGHSTRTWKVFLDLLRAHRVERVIDVRSVPRSRHNPQFNQETLRRKLRGARIGYVHLRKLGGLRHARRDSENTGWRLNSKAIKAKLTGELSPEDFADLKESIAEEAQRIETALSALESERKAMDE